MRDIGKNIRSLREEKGLTQDQLAEKLFVTRQTVSNYETGRSRPDVEMLIKIADTLDVDVDTVIYGVEPSPEQQLERKALVISVLLTFVLGIVWFILTPAAQEYRVTYFDATPLILLQVFVRPSLMLMLGWTVMQSFCVFLRAKRLKEERCRWFRRILLLLISLWLLLVLPPVVDMVRMGIIRWRWLQIHDSYFSVEHGLRGILYDMVWNRLSTYLLFYINKYCASFLIAGVGLWLTGFPKRKSSH